MIDIILKRGAHNSPDEGMCVMEAACFIAGEAKFSDHPLCVSPSLGEFLRAWNDGLDSVSRQKLVTFIDPDRKPSIYGTSQDGREEARALAAARWGVFTYAPAILELAGFDEQVAKLRALYPHLNEGTLRFLYSIDAEVRAGDMQQRPVVAPRERPGNVAADAAWEAAMCDGWLSLAEEEIVAAARGIIFRAGRSEHAQTNPRFDQVADDLNASALALVNTLIDPPAA